MEKRRLSSCRVRWWWTALLVGAAMAAHLWKEDRFLGDLNRARGSIARVVVAASQQPSNRTVATVATTNSDARSRTDIPPRRPPDDRKDAMELVPAHPSDVDRRNATAIVLCELSGELGNALGHYAHCHALVRMLHDDCGVPGAKIVLRRKTGATRSANARRDLQKCFPHFRSLDFEAGNTPSWERRVRELTSRGDPFRAVNSRSPGLVDRTLRSFVNAIQRHRASAADDDDIGPFLYGTQMAGLDFYVDRYLDDLRRTAFAFDSQACCRLVPYPDETVFHLRNYGAELSPAVAAAKGLIEPGPEQAAIELLGRMRDGSGGNNSDRVAVLSRFPNEAHPHVTALRNRGWEVRLLTNQSGTEDFCFLQSAQRGIVGLARSTYVRWASLLAPNGPKAELYSVGEPFFWYNFTHNAGLRSRLTFRQLWPDDGPALPPPGGNGAAATEAG